MRISTQLVSLLLMLVFWSSAHLNAQTYYWGTTNLYDDWHTGVHWFGGDLIFDPIPDNIDEAAVIQSVLDPFVAPEMHANVTLGALTIRPGASLSQNGYTLLINPGNGTSGNTNIQTDGTLYIQGGVYDCNGITINGTLAMGGGLTQADNWATIGEDGRLTGRGDFNLSSATLSNSGLIRATGNGELRIYGSGEFDWDGIGNGALVASTTSGVTTLRVELPPSDPFDGCIDIKGMNIGTQGVFSTPHDWELAGGKIFLERGLLEGGAVFVTSPQAEITSMFSSSNQIDCNVMMIDGTMTIGGALFIYGDASFSDNAIINLAPNSLLGVRSGSSSVGIAGNGEFMKLGAGSFDLAAANTFSGRTTVDEGTLNLIEGGSLSESTSLTVRSGATLTLAPDLAQNVDSLSGEGNVVLNGVSTLTVGVANAGGSGDFSGEIQGTGSMAKSGPDTLNLISANTYSGTTTISEGFLRVANPSGSATGSGDLVIQPGGSLVIEDGAINGDLLTILDGGSLTMTEGCLRLNNLELSGSLHANGGRLKVESVEGNLLVTGSVVEIGSSAGSMTVNGDLELADGATLEVEIAGTIPGTEFDQITVNGDLTVGGNLDVQTLPPFVLQDAQEFAIIESLGNVNGQFNGLGDGDLITSIDGVDLFISYQPNAVLLFTEPAEQSDPTKIDFQILEHIDDQTANHGTQYSEDGYTLDTSPNALASFGRLQPQFSGSTALFCQVVQGTTTMTKDDGGAFALHSINLAELNGDNVANVTFTGQLTDGGSTSQTFTIDGVAFGQETFLFDSSFGNVTSVSWTQESPYHQFDDIVFGAPVDPGILLGDVNLDGAVNLLDVDPFIAVLGAGVYQTEADCNEDGVVNLLDVDPFILRIAGG